MEELLTMVGINQFKNAVYEYNSKDLDLLGDGNLLNSTIKIETWSLEDKYKYLNLLIKVGDSLSTAISIKFIGNNLFDSTKISNYLGERFRYKLELSQMDGLTEEDSYFFTSNFYTSKTVLTLFIEILGDLELLSQNTIDVSKFIIPFKAFYLLKENIEENVKNQNDLEEMKEVAQIYMEYHGEEYRSKLYMDCKLLFTNPENLQITDLVEDIMYEFFNDDQILLEMD